LFSERVGLWAALGAALEPSSVAIGGLVLSEALFGSLLLLQFMLWYQGWRLPERRWAVACMLSAGLAAGLATLVRPGWLLYTPLSASISIVFSRERKRRAREAGLLFVGLVVALVPWWVRNACVTGRFVPTTLQVGAGLYDGLNPRATGAGNFDVVQAREDELRRALRAEGVVSLPVMEFRVNQALCRDAMAWARDHTGAALRLAVVKFFRTWNVWPNEPTLRSPLVRIVVLATYGPILVLALLGAFHYGCRGWPYACCWLPAVYLTLLHLVFVGSIRYRQPAMLTLVILAAAVVAEWYGTHASRFHR
jgi:4-amino-4-deoxy-L-arabinose transferase-like glycosyltransferase